MALASSERQNRWRCGSGACEQRTAESLKRRKWPLRAANRRIADGAEMALASSEPQNGW